MIIIHQATYGDKDGGYFLLNSSFENERIPYQLSGVTDLVDRPPNQNLHEPVIRGVIVNEYFLLIKTFGDFSEGIRKGRVFSHALFIGLNDYLSIKSISELTEFLLNQIDKDLVPKPFFFSEGISKDETKDVSNNFNSAVNALVQISEYENTIVFTDKKKYFEWLDLIWEHLPKEVKKNIRIGAAHNPTYIKSEKLNLVYIPSDLKSIWERTAYKVIVNDDDEEINSKAAEILLGKSNSLSTLCRELDIEIRGLEDYGFFEQYLDIYLYPEKTTKITDLLVLTDLVSKRSRSNKLEGGKKKILEAVSGYINSASINEVLALRYQSWNGFGKSAVEIISRQLESWIDSNIFVIKGIGISSLVNEIFLQDDWGWWNNCLQGSISKKIQTWEANFANHILEWFDNSPNLINKLGPLLPNIAEEDIVNCYSSKNDPTLQIVELAERKKWYLLYAAVHSKASSLEEAIGAQLKFDKNSDHLSGLRLISSQFPSLDFINLTIKSSNNRLYSVAFELIKADSSLVSRIDKQVPGWFRLWKLCEENNISVLDYSRDPKQLIYDLLNALLEGKHSDDYLLLRASRSRYSDLTDFKQRASIWGRLLGDTKLNFIKSTNFTNQCEKELLFRGILTDEVGHPNNNNDEFLTLTIKDKAITLQSVLFLFEKFKFRESTFLLILDKDYKSLNAQDSKLIGEVIVNNRWRKTFDRINFLVSVNGSLKIAIDYSKSHFTFNLKAKIGMNTEKKSSSNQRINMENKNILIVVATQLEAEVVLRKIKEIGNDSRPETMGKLVVWDLGTVNENALLMVKTTSMGSSGAGGSSLSVNDAINQIKPIAAIMIGIAFGLQPGDNQKIGTLLISKQIEGYELKKIKEDSEIQRADKISASVGLVNRFENAALNLPQISVNYGLIISGEKLVDNKDVVNRLQSIYPEAIGGEMEGEGFQSACHRNRVDGILMKGVCDWGYNKNSPDKRQDQQLAVGNACDFLIHTLNQFKIE